MERLELYSRLALSHHDSNLQINCGVMDTKAIQICSIPLEQNQAVDEVEALLQSLEQGIMPPSVRHS